MLFNSRENRVDLKGIVKMDKGLAYVDLGKSKIAATFKNKKDFYVTLYDKNNIKVDGWRKSTSAIITFDVKNLQIKETIIDDKKNDSHSYTCYAEFSWRPTSYATVYEISINKNGNTKHPPESIYNMPFKPGLAIQPYKEHIRQLSTYLPDKWLIYIGDYNRASAVMAGDKHYGSIIRKNSKGDVIFGIYTLGFSYSTTIYMGPNSSYLKPGEIDANRKAVKNWVEILTKGWTITVKPIT